MDEKKLDGLTKMTAILTCLSLIVGIVIGLIQIRNVLSKADVTMVKANQVLDAIKVEALSGVIDILDADKQIRVQQSKFDSERFNEKVNDAKSMLSAGKTGEQIYYSDGFKDFRNIVSHYERISVLIRLKYLEFPVIFEIIAFPDNFWNESREIRNIISSNWYGKGESLGDFLEGLSLLCDKYQKERLTHGSSVANNIECT